MNHMGASMVVGSHNGMAPAAWPCAWCSSPATPPAMGLPDIYRRGVSVAEL